MSAPLCLMTSCGAIELPSDFDIFRPSSATRKPCVSTSRNGGASARAEADEQRALEPAAVLVAAFEVHVGRPGQLGPDRQHRLVARPGVEPDVEDVHLALERRAAARRAREARRARTPRSAARTRRRRRTGSKTPAACSTSAGVVTASPHAVQSTRRDRHAPRRAGARCTSRAGWRPCCRCGRVPTPESTSPRCRWRRARPRAASARRAPGPRSEPSLITASPSMRMNHCDVARKMTGLWQRQQCGYWCENALAVPEPAAFLAAPPRPSGSRRRRAGRRRARRCRGSGRPGRSARRSRGRTSCRC